MRKCDKVKIIYGLDSKTEIVFAHPVARKRKSLIIQTLFFSLKSHESHSVFSIHTALTQTYCLSFRSLPSTLIQVPFQHTQLPSESSLIRSKGFLKRVTQH